MASSVQSVIALLVVALAAAGLIRAAVKWTRNPGCGSKGCGAVSPAMRKVQARVKQASRPGGRAR